jgi:hypothetical protein
MDFLKILAAIGAYVTVLMGGIWLVRWMGRRNR